MRHTKYFLAFYYEYYFQDLFVLCIHVFAWVYVYLMYPGFHESQKKAEHPLELEFLKVVNCQVCEKNQTQVLCKKSKHF